MINKRRQCCCAILAVLSCLVVLASSDATTKSTGTVDDLQVSVRQRQLDSNYIQFSIINFSILFSFPRATHKYSGRVFRTLGERNEATNTLSIRQRCETMSNRRKQNDAYAFASRHAMESYQRKEKGKGD